MKARVATGEERERIWEAQKKAVPNFAKYEKTAGSREIPVVVLDKIKRHSEDAWPSAPAARRRCGHL